MPKKNYKFSEPSFSLKDQDQRDLELKHKPQYGEQA